MSENGYPTEQSAHDPRAVYVEIYGPAAQVERVAGWIESASGSRPLMETNTDPETPEWVRCRMVVVAPE